MRLKLCRCKRVYTHFSFCMKCFTDFIDKHNKGKQLLVPISKQPMLESEKH